MAEQQTTILSTVKEYGRGLLRFIRSRVGTDEDSEDILQDVWYQLSNEEDIGTIEQMSAWLFRVARNKITDRYRKQKTKSLEDYEYEDEEGDIGFSDILLSDQHTPEDQQLKDIFWDELMAALEDLPESQRSVYVQNELEDKTLQQIADASGENLKTIISRKRYAVKHLRTRLQYLYNDIMNE